MAEHLERQFVPLCDGRLAADDLANFRFIAENVDSTFDGR
jgi:hypothetical protein